MTSEPEFGLDIDFSVYEEKDYLWSQLTGEEKQRVSLWVSSELPSDNTLNLLEVNELIQSEKKYQEVQRLGNEELAHSEEIYDAAMKEASQIQNDSESTETIEKENFGKQETLFDHLTETYSDDVVQQMKGETTESANEATTNRYLQVEFNESNPALGIKRYQGQIVTPDLVTDLKAMENRVAERSEQFKFYFNEIIDGKVVDNYGMSVGIGNEANQSMYEFLDQSAISKEIAARIAPGLVVVGGDEKAALSDQIKSKSINHYFRVASNEIYSPIFQENHSGQIVTKDFISDLYKWAGQATYPNPASIFTFEEIVKDKVVDTIDLEVGGGRFEEKKSIFDRLSAGAVGQEQLYEYTIQAKTIDNKIVFYGKERDHEQGTESFQELVIEPAYEGIRLYYYGTNEEATYENVTEAPVNEIYESIIVRDLPEDIDERIKNLLKEGPIAASVITFKEIEQIYRDTENYQVLEKDHILANMADQYGLILDKAFSSKDYEQIFGYPAARTEKEILAMINQQRNERVVDWAYRETYSPEEIEFYKEDRVLNLQKKLIDGHMFYQIDEQAELLLQPSKENSSQFEGMIFNQLGSHETFSADSPRAAAQKLADLGANPCSKDSMSFFKNFLSQENNRSHQQHLIHNRVMQETYREETGRSMGR